MSSLRILVVFSITCLCPTTAEPALTLTFERPGYSAFHVNFDTAVLEQFHGCLCDTTSFFCALKLSQDEARATAFFAVWREGRRSLIDASYSNSYSCFVSRSRYYPYTPRSISCTRLAESVASYIIPPDEPCEVLSLISNSQGMCDLSCINILWTGTTTGTVTGTNTEKANCGQCELTTSTTTTTVTTGQITTGQTTALNISSLSAINTTVNSEDNGDEETENELSTIVGFTVAAILLILVIFVVVVFLFRRKQHKLKSQVSNMSLLYANQSVSLEVQASSAQKAAEVEAVSAAWRHENSKVSGKTCLSVKYSNSSQVTPHRPEEIRNSANAFAGDQIFDGHMVVQEPHSMEIRTETSSSPDVYSRLHEKARHFQNPYDMLLDSTANLKARSSLPIRTQQNGRDFSGSSLKSVEAVSYPVSKITPQEIRDVQGIVNTEDMDEKQMMDITGSAIDISCYQDIDGNAERIDTFTTQDNDGHYSLAGSTLNVPTYQDLDDGVNTADTLPTQSGDIHYSLIDSSINIPTYQDVNDDVESVDEFQTQSEGVQYATIGSTLNLTTYQNAKYTNDESVKSKNQNQAGNHDRSFTCNVYEDVAESNPGDSAEKDETSANDLCEDSEIYKNIGQIANSGLPNCRDNLAERAPVDIRKDVNKLNDEISNNTVNADEPGYATVGNQNPSVNHVYANFPDEERNLQNVYFVLEKEAEYQE